MLCYFQVCSKVDQWYVYTHPLFFRCFSHISHYRLLSWVLCAVSVQFSSVQFSCSVVSDSLWPHESQHARPPCPSPTPGVHSDSHPWVGDAIQPSHPLSSPSPPAPNPSQHQSLFQWVNSSREMDKVLEFRSLLVTYLIYRSVYMSIPIFKFILPTSFPTGNRNFVFYICHSVCFVNTLMCTFFF